MKIGSQKDVTTKMNTPLGVTEYAMYRDELFEGDQREEEERVDQVQIIDILLI